LLEPTLGYTGVNIKLPVDVDYTKLKLKVREYTGKEVTTSFVTFYDYLKKYKKKDLKKTIYNTFLVFQSGKVIMSGKVGLFMNPGYYAFVEVLKKCDKIIREDIVGPDTVGKTN
jgi:hypothetical protein